MYELVVMFGIIAATICLLAGQRMIRSEEALVCKRARTCIILANEGKDA